MRWSEAILLSPINKAMRKTIDGRLVLRSKDRIVVQHFFNLFRGANPEHYKGFNDWVPCKRKGKYE